MSTYDTVNQSSSQDTGNTSNVENVAGLISYITELAAIMADADRDKLKEFLDQPLNTEILRSFVLNKDHRNICVTKREEEKSEQFKDYFLETIPELKPFPTSTIVFIKRVDFLDCNDKKKIKKRFTNFEF